MFSDEICWSHAALAGWSHGWSERTREGGTFSLNPAFPLQLASVFPEWFVRGPWYCQRVCVHGFCCVFVPRVELRSLEVVEVVDDVKQSQKKWRFLLLFLEPLTLWYSGIGWENRWCCSAVESKRSESDACRRAKLTCTSAHTFHVSHTGLDFHSPTQTLFYRYGWWSSKNMIFFF